MMRPWKTESDIFKKSNLIVVVDNHYARVLTTNPRTVKCSMSRSFHKSSRYLKREFPRILSH